MSIKSHRRILMRRSSVFVGGLLVLFALAGLAVGARAWRTSATVRTSLAEPTAKAATPAAPQGRSQKQRVEGEIVALGPNGFEPKQITRPRGPFLLVVENESRLPVVTLLLHGDVGPPIRNVLVARERRTWSDIVDLPPGTYKLREVTRPRWVCNITIR
jgi:hypothetical protein